MGHELHGRHPRQFETVVQNGSHQRSFTYDWVSRLLTANNFETGTITYNYDSDSSCASPNSFAGLLVSKVDARGIRTCAQYDALNRETVLNYSNQDPTITTTYNNRLQPSEFKASSTGGNADDISYNFVDPVSGHNAGHVYGVAKNLDATRSQNFTYDQLNRISSALTVSTHGTSPAHCWGETYTLDAWGTLNSIAATTNSNYTGCTQEPGFTTTADGNNHFPSFSYDSSGNTQNDAVFTYSWHAESQLKSGGGVTYTYDGHGRRVAKVGSKLYWYGSGGDILAETDASGNTTAEYIFFGGKRIAMLPAGGNPIYYVEDMLGTSRVITSNSGIVCYDADFYPYGGERAYTNTCAQNYKFEGKERGTETGNDEFGARYYSDHFGRWLSADWSSVPEPVPYANLSNPQTLNLYSMVGDDPESFADLDGHDDKQGPNPVYQCFDGNVANCSQALRQAYAAYLAARQNDAAKDRREAPSQRHPAAGMVQESSELFLFQTLQRTGHGCDGKSWTCEGKP